MTGASDPDAILGDYNFTSLPDYDVVESGGTYTISFAFLTSSTLSTVTDDTSAAYYNGVSFYARDFSQATSQVQDAYRIIMETAGPGSYTNYYSDVADITFAEQTGGSPNAAITIGELTNAVGDPVFNTKAVATGNVDVSSATLGSSTDEITINGQAVVVGDISQSTLESNLTAAGLLGFFKESIDSSSGYLTLKTTANENLVIADGPSGHTGGLVDLGLTAGTITAPAGDLYAYAVTRGYAASLGASLASARYGDIWLNAGTQSDGTTPVDNWGTTASSGSQNFAIVLHELGHSLGLDHPASTASDDSLYYTIMFAAEGTTVFPGMNTVGPGGTPVYVSGLQMDDINTIQSIYDANFSTRHTNTFYGMGAGFSANSSTGFVTTIWDGGGVNVIDARGYTGPAIINLNQAEFSSIGPGDANGVDGWSNPNGSSFNNIAYDNVAIAYGTVIQNAIGTASTGTTSGDIFFGNLWDNVLAATGGYGTFYTDQTIYPTVALGAGINWVGDAITNGLTQWSTDPYYAAPSTLKNDVLIGDGLDNTFYMGKANDVVDGGYNATDINNATSSWATAWDSAHQFTATPGTGVVNNVSGTAVAAVSDSSATGNTASYLNLYLDDSAIVAGTASTGIVVTKASTPDAEGKPEFTVVKGASGVDGTDTLINIQTIIGTGAYDVFSAMPGVGNTVIYQEGSGNSLYIFSVEANNGGNVEINHTSGQASLNIQSTVGDQLAGISVDVSTSSGGVYTTGDTLATISTTQSFTSGAANFVLDLTPMAAGTSFSTVAFGGYTINAQAFAEYVIANPTAFLTATAPATVASDVDGGSVGPLMPTPVYDPHTGALTGMTAPTYVSSGLYVDPTLGQEIDHPWVVTGLSQFYTDPPADLHETTILTLQTYVDALLMYEPASDIRIVWSGPSTDNLTVYAVSEAKSFVIPDFTGGKTIYGIATLGNTLYDELAPNATGLTSSSSGNYSGTFATPGGPTISTSSFGLTYYLEQMGFSDNTVWNMQSGGLTFTSAVDSQYLYARDGHNDTLVAMNTGNVMVGSTGNTTMVAGAGSSLHNGTGADTDVFSAGAAPISGGGDLIEANESGGTATIHLQGIAPSAVTMWDNNSGWLMIQYSSTDEITVVDGSYASSTGVTLTGLSAVTFDSSYSTTWSLTGGLTLTASSDNQYLYGISGGGDTLIAAGTGDHLIAFGGTETLVAGAGATLNNGSGTDTDVFSAGSAPISGGGDAINLNTSGGTAAIVLHGVTPSAVTMWDNNYAQFFIQFSSTDEIIVAGGSYSGSTGFNLGGLTGITFDDSTHWDLTSGVTLTASSNYQTIYGTTGGGDTLIAAGTGDYLHAFGGAETLVAGAGATLNNGSGTDTDVFSAGTAPISGGGDAINLNGSGGTATVAFHGIDPSAVTMWDNHYSQFFIQFSSTDEITVGGGSYSGSTGFTLGSLTGVTFDDSGHTTWDLTGGLTLTASSDYQTIYGTTSGGDTLIAAGTGDTLTAFAGAETLVAGPGATLNNGTGNDTDVINSGASPSSNSATINANASGGTSNAILFHSVVSSDITTWDTTGGNLIIATPTDQVTVSGGSFSWSTGFAVGNMHDIAFDSGSPISLTGGLNLTAVHDSQSIYGTGHGDHLTAAGNYDSLYGIAGNNIMTGDSGTTGFYGGSGNELMVAGSGTNNMTMGSGADEVKVESASSTTSVSGFSTSSGDTLNIEDTISGYDPLADALSNFVQKTESSGNTVISVDPTGSGTFSAPLVTLSGVTGLDDVATLVAHGVLIVHG